MLLKLLLLIFSTNNTSYALGVFDVHCESEKSNYANCKIQLDGEVMPGDSLLISEVRDMDSLYYGKMKIGSTGLFAGRKFYAAYIPRVYSLDAIIGITSPTLELKIESFFSERAKIPRYAQIKIVSADTPLRKILFRPTLLTFEFIVLASLSIFAFLGLLRGVVDGWSYPRHELRAFLISTFLYLLFHTEFLRSICPWLLSANFYMFLSRISSAVMIWATARLLLEGYFSDRSCVVRNAYKKAPKLLLTLSNISLIIPLFSFTWAHGHRESFAILLGVSLIAAYLSAKNLEWKRILKRSATGSFLFHMSLFFVSIGLPILELLKNSGMAGEQVAKILSAICLFTATWRVVRYRNASKRSERIVEDIRSDLTNIYRGEDRLQKLCEKIEGEWGFARVTLISVQEGQGIVIASAGIDAIPVTQWHHPKKLGPFLRRVCKEGHLLYAPVAEELGKDLQEKGLKHSSLGIPLMQENKVIAVLCMMADEDERIPPYEATMVDLVIQSIRLEIVSAALQSSAEERNTRIMSVAKANGSLVLEHIDNWGRLHQPKHSLTRAIVAAKLQQNDQIFEEAAHSEIIKIVFEAYCSELRSIWFNLRKHFEFLSKDIRADDFWAISPKEFVNPTLSQLGENAVSIILASLLEKHARLLALRADYLILGLSGANVSVANANLHFVPIGSENLYGLEILPANLAQINKMRRLAQPGEILSQMNPQKHKLNSTYTIKHKTNNNEELYSVLALYPDKKEIRKIEFLAIESAKESLRKKAA